jgi:tyrosine-protein phosphatase YwqE
MFFTRKKNTETTDLGWLHADMHSHLVPGIDDGSPDVATSLELIRGMMQLGYKKIITTPHILKEVYPNSEDTILPGIEKLKEAAAAEGLDVELGAAAEYFIDEHFEEHLKSRKPLLRISGNMVLVEFSMVTAPMDLQEVLFEMQMQDYQPVIAHPERYIYLARKKEFFDELKNTGCFFQLNLLSLIGHYGSAVQQLAEHLIKQNHYDLAGTDLHNTKHLAALQKLSQSPALKKLKESGVLKNSLL